MRGTPAVRPLDTFALVTISNRTVNFTSVTAPLSVTGIDRELTAHIAIRCGMHYLDWQIAESTNASLHPLEG